MPNLAFVSAKEIMPRVIRALGYKIPSAYHDDLLEWIPEGMGFIQVTNSLIPTSSGECGEVDELRVENHCVKLPCGFVSILAVEDENRTRIPEGENRFYARDAARRARVSVFEVNPFHHQTSDGVPTTQPGTSVPLYGEDLTPVDESSCNSYYNIKGNYIQTSFECGFIRIHYLALPVDKEGYPLIPDNENFKQALEWHIIRRLIGSGYEHKVFSYKDANELFEVHAARAMNEVSYYTPDKAAKVNRNLVRLIPPNNYSYDFFAY